MLFISLVLQAKDKDVAVAEALLKRLLPSYIESFQFQKLKGEKDCFTIESVKDKIVIGGNNANSMAMGLNHYLKYYCLTTVSWYADIAVFFEKLLSPFSTHLLISLILLFFRQPTPATVSGIPHIAENGTVHSSSACRY